jgi:putative sigma-54 modulation protein
MNEEGSMQVAIHNFRTDLAEAFKSYVERRLQFALNRFGQRVGRVIVRLCPDGPAAIRCSININVQPFGRIAVEESDSDLFAAIDRATGKIGHLLGRELERVQGGRVGRESVRSGPHLDAFQD